MLHRDFANHRPRFLFLLPLLLWLTASAAFAQSTTFTYQGRLSNDGAPADGQYDFKFTLWDGVTGGMQQPQPSPATVSQDNVLVTSGVFTVALNFGAGAFPGADRFLEISVRPHSTDPNASYTTLTPRQAVTVTPYAIRVLTAGTADTATNAQQLGGVAASGYVQTTDVRLTDARPPTTGSGNYIQNNTAQQASANFNISGAGTLGSTLTANSVSVQSSGLYMNSNLLRLRNSSDNNHGMLYNSTTDGPEFRGFAGFVWKTGLNGATQQMSLDNTGLLSVAIVSATTRYNLGTFPILSAPGTSNLFVGLGAGNANTGSDNTFVGPTAGLKNTTGSDNAFFGKQAGQNNLSGGNNVFLGSAAGINNTSGGNNVFIGALTGQQNLTGGSNTFVGDQAGQSTNPGDHNTVLGAGANIAGPVSYATAIGAGSNVFASNTIALGRPDGSDTFMPYGKVVINNFGTAGSQSLCRNTNGEISFCSSSLRYKTNIAPFSLGLQLVNRLRPITFDWKADGMHDLGLGAEEVAAVEPLLVTYNKAGQVEGVKYDRVGVVLLNAVKERQAQIEGQQAQIEGQRKQLTEQQRLINGLRQLVCAQNPTAEVCQPGAKKE